MGMFLSNGFPTTVLIYIVHPDIKNNEDRLINHPQGRIQEAGNDEQGIKNGDEKVTHGKFSKII